GPPSSHETTGRGRLEPGLSATREAIGRRRVQIGGFVCPETGGSYVLRKSGRDSRRLIPTAITSACKRWTHCRVEHRNVTKCNSYAVGSRESIQLGTRFSACGMRFKFTVTRIFRLMCPGCNGRQPSGTPISSITVRRECV